MTSDRRNSTFTIPRHQYGEQWRVDDEGYLHTGQASAHADSVVLSIGSKR